MSTFKADTSRRNAEEFERKAKKLKEISPEELQKMLDNK